eukprot:463164-Pyramimonas_sp.AAC.1
MEGNGGGLLARAADASRVGFTGGWEVGGSPAQRNRCDDAFPHTVKVIVTVVLRGGCVAQVRDFCREQKRFIRDRQRVIEEGRAQVKANMAAGECATPPLYADCMPRRTTTLTGCGCKYDCDYDSDYDSDCGCGCEYDSDWLWMRIRL